MNRMSYYDKRPLKDLNWKRIIKEVLINLLHTIGIMCLTGCALWLVLITYSFLIYGGIVLYELNLTISIIEFLISIYAFLYGWYLFIKFYKSIK